jgi:hypothetical protein
MHHFQVGGALHQRQRIQVGENPGPVFQVAARQFPENKRMNQDAFFD